MRRQNWLHCKNATLLKNALSFFRQSVLQTSEMMLTEGTTALEIICSCTENSLPGYGPSKYNIQIFQQPRIEKLFSLVVISNSINPLAEMGKKILLDRIPLNLWFSV